MSASTPNTAVDLAEHRAFPLLNEYEDRSAPRDAVHVAVAVIENATGAVLISRRHPDTHQGGLWEFPGGKVEEGETTREALRRELKEELGLNALQFRPLIQVDHSYSDRRVYLDVWRVLQWEGAPHGREGQPIRWMLPASLSRADFPAANWPIIQAVRLPPLYVITPDPTADETWLSRLESVLAAGVRLLQYRDPSAPDEFRVRAVIETCHRRECRVLLNAAPEVAVRLGADGVHLNGERLRRVSRRPLPPEKFIVGASCHTREELTQAERISADFAVLGPVQPTASHPHAAPLGWAAFAGLVAGARLPIYALGGLGPGDMAQAWNAGAQGVAMIRGIWSPPDCAAAVRRCLNAS